MLCIGLAGPVHCATCHPEHVVMNLIACTQPALVIYIMTSFNSRPDDQQAAKSALMENEQFAH